VRYTCPCSFITARFVQVMFFQAKIWPIFTSFGQNEQYHITCPIMPYYNITYPLSYYEYYNTPYYTTLRHTTPHRAILHHIAPYYTTSRHTTPHRAILHRIAPYYTTPILHCAHTTPYTYYTAPILHCVLNHVHTAAPNTTHTTSHSTSLHPMETVLKLF
jgi:hypothetical protein